MASEKQIEANRRNAAKSTGPRTAAGKKRSAKNSFRYGLTVSVARNPVLARRLAKTARLIAGRNASAVTSEHARQAAEALLELERIRRTKLALIEQASAVGELDPLHLRGSSSKMIRQLKRILSGDDSDLVDPMVGMPPDEPGRSAEAMRRIVPELVQFDLYESRAIIRRDMALLDMAHSKRDACLTRLETHSPLLLS